MSRALSSLSYLLSLRHELLLLLNDCARHVGLHAPHVSLLHADLLLKLGQISELVVSPKHLFHFSVKVCAEFRNFTN